MKFISLLLCVCVVFTSFFIFTFSSFAETSGDYEYKILDDNTAEITKYTGHQSNINIPSSLDGHKVASIGTDSFYKNEEIVSVVVPDSVKRIDSGAFEYAENLKNISLPDTLEHMGALAFYKTAFFESKPDGPVYLGNYLIQYKGIIPSKYSLTVKEGTKLIASFIFDGKKQLEHVNFPNSLRYIGDYAFNGCENLDNVVIPDSVVDIGSSSFRRCKSLSYVSLSNKLEEIDSYAFYECEKLQGITIPTSVKYIGMCAFTACINMSSVYIPSSVLGIDFRAFGYSKDGSKYLPFVIYGVNGTEAERYANANDIPFISGIQKIYGDADDNKVVDIMDATCIQKYLVNLTKKINLNNADTQNRGTNQVDIMDAVNIQKYLVKMRNIDGTAPYRSDYPINP